jgi:hypothetical protein
MSGVYKDSLFRSLFNTSRVAACHPSATPATTVSIPSGEKVVGWRYERSLQGQPFQVAV